MTENKNNKNQSIIPPFLIMLLFPLTILTATLDTPFSKIAIIFLNPIFFLLGAGVSFAALLRILKIIRERNR